jgi:hypothetical protein
VLTVAITAAGAASGAQRVQILKEGAGPLDTGFVYVPWGVGDSDATQFERMRAAGAKFARISVTWSSIAPAGLTMPVGFRATDPADPNYDWSDLDVAIRAVAAAGLQPIVEIQSAPIWAEGTASTRPSTAGGYEPSPSAFAQFVTAAATRYSGKTEGLPRVSYWSIWNEPNLIAFLKPQLRGKSLFAALRYRAMVNAAAKAINKVDASNVVIAGETSPFGGPAANRTMPLRFMEKVLCVSEKRVRNKRTRKVRIVYRSVCKARTQFDVWAQHPYTEGGPSKKARLHGNVSLGNMSDMRAVLNAAIRAKHVVSNKKVRLWITEFSWDSKPPDPKGVPAALEARWVAETLYRSWSAGVSLFTWFLVRDQPFEPGSFYQSGLYYAPAANDIAADKPKPALRAFRFPFVAIPQAKKAVFVWGRTPTGTQATVLIERKTGGRWRRVQTTKANRYGIFRSKIREPAKTLYLRARLADGSDQSVPFSLRAPKKPWTGCAFGSCGIQAG